MAEAAAELPVIIVRPAVGKALPWPWPGCYPQYYLPPCSIGEGLPAPYCGLRAAAFVVLVASDRRCQGADPGLAGQRQQPGGHVGGRQHGRHQVLGAVAPQLRHGLRARRPRRQGHYPRGLDDGHAAAPRVSLAKGIHHTAGQRWSRHDDVVRDALGRHGSETIPEKVKCVFDKFLIRI